MTKDKELYYVEQRQAVITRDPDIELVTTGMTECIGMILKGRSLKSCVHFDGFVLYDKKTAFDNIKKIKDHMNQCSQEDYITKIILFGGRENSHNDKMLRDALSYYFPNIKKEKYFNPHISRNFF